MILYLTSAVGISAGSAEQIVVGRAFHFDFRRVWLLRLFAAATLVTDPD